MPTLVCPDLGQIDFAEDEILDFREGLPAFETMKRFLLVQKAEVSPFMFLVSVDAPTLRFVCIPISVIEPGYHFEIAGGDGASLGLDDGAYSAAVESPLLLAIVTLPSQGAATANLASPVVVDKPRRLGAQVILPWGNYSHLTPLRPAAAVEELC